MVGELKQEGRPLPYTTQLGCVCWATQIFATLSANDHGCSASIELGVSNRLVSRQIHKHKEHK